MLVQFFAFFDEIGVLFALLNEFYDVLAVTVAQKLFAIYIKAGHRVGACNSHEHPVSLEIYDFFDTKNVSLSNAPHSSLDDFCAYLIDVLQAPLILHRQLDTVFKHEVKGESHNAMLYEINIV